MEMNNAEGVQVEAMTVPQLSLHLSRCSVPSLPSHDPNFCQYNVFLFIIDVE